MKSITIEVNSFRNKTQEFISSYSLDNNIDVETKDFSDRTDFIINTDIEKINFSMDSYIWTSKLIRKLIWNIHGKKLIHDRLIKRLKSLSKDEKQNIVISVYNMILDEGCCYKEKIAINKDIRRILSENNLFNVDGYLRFKSHKINKLIDNYIEIVLNDINTENEYNEFIDLLQFYVDGQIPMYDLVNVVINKDNFKILDINKKEIENGSIDEVVEDINFENINKSDILVSSLIVLAPKNIVLHIENHKEPELISVLKEIFTDRISICNGCSTCKLNINKKKNLD